MWVDLDKRLGVGKVDQDGNGSIARRGTVVEEDIRWVTVPRSSHEFGLFGDWQSF